MGLICPYSSQIFNFRLFLQDIATTRSVEDKYHFCCVEAYRITIHILDILSDIKDPAVIYIVLDFFEIINRQFFFSNIDDFDFNEISKIISTYFAGIVFDSENYLIYIDVKAVNESLG